MPTPEEASQESRFPTRAYTFWRKLFDELQFPATAQYCLQPPRPIFNFLWINEFSIILVTFQIFGMQWLSHSGFRPRLRNLGSRRLCSVAAAAAVLGCGGCQFCASRVLGPGWGKVLLSSQAKRRKSPLSTHTRTHGRGAARTHTYARTAFAPVCQAAPYLFSICG